MRFGPAGYRAGDGAPRDRTLTADRRRWLRGLRLRAAAARRALDSGRGRRYPVAGRQLAGGWRPARLGGGALALRDLREYRAAHRLGRRGDAQQRRTAARLGVGRPRAGEPGVRPRPRRRAAVDRDAAGGRFLAGAAVSYDHLVVAAYWTAGCAPL